MTSPTPQPTPVPTPLPLAPGEQHDGFFLWGAPKAGKSGLLGALYGLSRSDEGERWTAHPKDCDDPHTQEHLLRAYEELRVRRNTKTGVRDTPYRPLRLTLRRMRAGREVGQLRLALVDPAGEFGTDPGHRLSTAGKALYTQVATSHGLLWLFEVTPDGAPSTLDRLLILEQLVALLEAGGAAQLHLPVALCLSKIDCLSPERRQAAIDDPTAAVLEHLGATSLTWFEAVCPTLRCFALSSAGTVAEKVRPIGVNEVLDWFASERDRRLRAAKAMELKGQVASLVRRWGASIARGAGVMAVVAGVAWGVGEGEWGMGKGDSGIVTREAGARETGAQASGSGAQEPRRGTRTDGARPTRSNGDVAREGRPTSSPEPRAASSPHSPFPIPPSRDSMFAALREGIVRERDGRSGERYFRRAYRQASLRIEHGTPGSRDLTPERLVRARACMLGGLDCPRQEIDEDLTWVLIHGDDVERRLAVRLLDELGEHGGDG
jgi:hypothetical protein